MLQNIKNENAKIMKKVDVIMHSKLQIKKVKKLVKESKKRNMYL